MSLAAGVDQISPSTPGVRRPRFSVTFLTASSLAEKERVRQRCSCRTRRHCCCPVALAIRSWSLCTRLRTVDQSISVHDTISVGVCTIIGQLYHDARCSVRSGVFAIEDPLDVSHPFGVGGDVGSTAASILAATARPSLLPASYTQPAVTSPCGSVSTFCGTVWGYPVPHECIDSVRCGLYSGSLVSACPQRRQGSNQLRTFWFKLVSLFSLVGLTERRSAIHVRSPYESGLAPLPHQACSLHAGLAARAYVFPRVSSSSQLSTDHYWPAPASRPPAAECRVESSPPCLVQQSFMRPEVAQMFC